MYQHLLYQETSSRGHNSTPSTTRSYSRRSSSQQYTSNSLNIVPKSATSFTSLPNVNEMAVSKKIFDDNITNTPYSDKEDASLFNMKQIEFLRIYDTERFNSMDIVRCDDHLINNMFPVKNGNEVMIPFEKKNTVLYQFKISEVRS